VGDRETERPRGGLAGIGHTHARTHQHVETPPRAAGESQLGSGEGDAGETEIDFEISAKTPGARSNET
jgi:hypothetical protein